MGEGVIPNDVSGLDGFADDVWALLNMAADTEKGGVHAVSGEDFEQGPSVRDVGAVVEGEGELARAAWQSGEGWTTPLGGRRYGLVAGSGGCGRDGGSGEGKANHARIVTGFRIFNSDCDWKIRALMGNRQV